MSHKDVVMVEHEDEPGHGGMASEDRDCGNCEGEKCSDDLPKGLDHVEGCS